jgi:nicotinate-nucleotide pyrophosphorylase (carboxylating)
LEKYAVRAGGGSNHRFGLSDGVLVKDNHHAALARAGISLRAALEKARRTIPHTVRIEVEVETPEQAREALDAGADILLLDNMSLEAMREVVSFARGRCLTEASGNITLERIAAVAATGVDLISAGALTHSAPALDISLDCDL